jgi:hypothetical protein
MGNHRESYGAIGLGHSQPFGDKPCRVVLRPTESQGIIAAAKPRAEIFWALGADGD